MSRRRPFNSASLAAALCAWLALSGCGEERSQPVEEKAPGNGAASLPQPSAAQPVAETAQPAVKTDGGLAAEEEETASQEGGPRALVLRASGPAAGSMRVGQLVGGRQLLTLRRGDRLGVLFEGKVLEFRGPRVFSIAGSEGSVVDEPLFDWDSGEVRSRIAGTRRERPAQPLWAASAADSGRHCLPSRAPPQLWSAEAATVAVTDAKTGATSTVTFESGSTAQPWPEAVPFRPNRTYALAAGDGPPTRVTFIRLRADKAGAEDPGERLARMSEQGCGAQVQRVARRVAGF
jgi:hypothetical protein